MRDLLEIIREALERRSAGEAYPTEALELAVAEITRLRAVEPKFHQAVASLQRLARLGNGDRLGNSDGNVMAQAALREIGVEP